MARCHGLSPASSERITEMGGTLSGLRGIMWSGAYPVNADSVKFCSTSDTGRTELRQFVYWRMMLPELSANGRALSDGTYFSNLYPVDFAVRHGLVTASAATRFDAGTRRSASELSSQRRQTREDQLRADSQARRLTGFEAFAGDVGEAAGSLASGLANTVGKLGFEGAKQFLNSLSPVGALAVMGAGAFLVYKVVKAAAPLAELANKATD